MGSQRRGWRHLAACGLMAGLGAIPACNVAPTYQPPKVSLPSEFKTTGPWRTATPGDHAPRGAWWREFRDSRLADLLQQAEAGNPTLELALHRVDEARAVARADRADLFPSLSLGGGTARTRTSGTLENSFAGGRTRTVILIGFDLDYELDLWGRLRNQSSAARAGASAVEADYRNVLLSLQAEVALNYFALRSTDSEIALLKRAIELRQKAFELATTRFRQGDTAQLDVAQAETELNSARSEAIGLEKGRAELEHAIALLLGKTPSAFSVSSIPLDRAPPSIPGSVPSDLLERRPDIASAERTMAEENARIGVARAALFPSVRIGATGGLESSFIEDLADAASRVWGLGPSVEWPVFDAGKRRAETDAARARYNQAAASYRATVLKAVREVEDALSGLEVLRRQLGAQEQTVTAAERTVELAQKRYASGLVAYYEVLDAQRTLLRAEQDATRIRRDQFLSTVLLIKAIGGGW